MKKQKALINLEIFIKKNIYKKIGGLNMLYVGPVMEIVEFDERVLTDIPSVSSPNNETNIPGTDIVSGN